MIYLKTDEEIELMRVANQLVGKTLGELAKHVAPGVTTLQLDKIAEEFINTNGAKAIPVVDQDEATRAKKKGYKQTTQGISNNCIKIILLHCWIVVELYSIWSLSCGLSNLYRFYYILFITISIIIIFLL